VATTNRPERLNSTIETRLVHKTISGQLQPRDFRNTFHPEVILDGVGSETRALLLSQLVLRIYVVKCLPRTSMHDIFCRALPIPNLHALSLLLMASVANPRKK
jgi:hypothetical protein